MIDFDIFDDINESSVLYEFVDDIDGEDIIIEFDDDTEIVQETYQPYDEYLKRHQYDPKTNTLIINGKRVNAGRTTSKKERHRINAFLRDHKFNPDDETILTDVIGPDGSPRRMTFIIDHGIPTTSLNAHASYVGHDFKSLTGIGDRRYDQIQMDDKELKRNRSSSEFTFGHEQGHHIVAERVRQQLEEAQKLYDFAYDLNNSSKQRRKAWNKIFKILYSVFGTSDLKFIKETDNKKAREMIIRSFPDYDKAVAFINEHRSDLNEHDQDPEEFIADLQGYKNHRKYKKDDNMQTMFITIARLKRLLETDIQRCKRIVKKGNIFATMSDDDFVQHVFDNRYMKLPNEIIESSPILTAYFESLDRIAECKDRLEEQMTAVTDYETYLSELKLRSLDSNPNDAQQYSVSIEQVSIDLEKCKTKYNRTKSELDDAIAKSEQIRSSTEFKASIANDIIPRKQDAINHADKRIDKNKRGIAKLRNQQNNLSAVSSEDLVSDRLRNDFIRKKQQADLQKQQSDEAMRRGLQKQQLQQQISNDQLNSRQRQKTQRKLQRLERYDQGISNRQAALQRSMAVAPTQDTSQSQAKPVEEKPQSLSVDNPTGKPESKPTKESYEYITYDGVFFESSDERVDDTDIRISICSELENIIKPWLEVPPEIWDIDKVGYSAPVESFPENWLHNTETLPLIEEFLTKMKEPCQNVVNLLKDLDNEEFENINEFVEDTSLTVKDLLDSDVFKTSDWEDKLTQEHIDEINSIHEFVDQTIKAVIAWIKKIYPQYMEFNIGLRRLTSGDRSVLDE